MALNRISNGNTAFRIDNDVEPGTWGSASFNAMLLAGADHAELRTMAKGGHAEFTKKQIETIGAHMLELASEMPDHR